MCIIISYGFYGYGAFQVAAPTLSELCPYSRLPV